ncbi:hypothetical protein LARV_01362 [Longilinea arvoryzae]|uniref:Uncharacterized protein n=1 Tax=Longilinea arvoryzae TaxID=360412 RepID=A0A0S7B8D8_9CHLR|nr:hypothetical protein LARV_01362 [Longilinea arvoryzae]
MVHEMIIKRIPKKPYGKVHDLLRKHSAEDPDKINRKREQFLTLIRNRYGYTNEKAVDELKRLLGQFYRTNRSFSQDRTRLKPKHSAPE